MTYLLMGRLTRFHSPNELPCRYRYVVIGLDDHFLKFSAFLSACVIHSHEDIKLSLPLRMTYLLMGHLTRFHSPNELPCRYRYVVIGLDDHFLKFSAFLSACVIHSSQVTMSYFCYFIKKRVLLIVEFNLNVQ